MPVFVFFVSLRGFSGQRSDTFQINVKYFFHTCFGILMASSVYKIKVKIFTTIPDYTISEFGVATAHPNIAFCVGIKISISIHSIQMVFYRDAERVIWVRSPNSELAYNIQACYYVYKVELTNRRKVLNIFWSLLLANSIL